MFDAQSACLQSDGIRRLFLLRMPHKNPPPGKKPGQMFVETVAFSGTRNAGRAWYEHSKKVLEAACFVESRQEQGFYNLHGPSQLEALVHTHVDDFLSALKKSSKKHKGPSFATFCAQASFETTIKLVVLCLEGQFAEMAITSK